MNSYPPELLLQLAPVMFVAGLDIPATEGVTRPTSPSSTPAMQKPQNIFQLLVIRLREALLTHRKSAIWQPEKTKSFHVVMVEKDVRFPPRKLVPPDDPQYSAAHSPLSPLTQTSPLHPDGLIAPIWVRKHTNLLPSVFVLFLRIYEHPPHPTRTPIDGPSAEYERERELEEKKKDTELSNEIALRKKSTSERNIKLTVVLLASRRLLDDPTLDSRLTFIRRQSGLDSRAALFVLSPVSQAELSDFVNSLEQALHDTALEYYTGQSKRVRRKRNRHSQNVSSYPNAAAPIGNLAIARPLRPEGWTVRYEYKMACFAEFRGEHEVALKHYQDAYGMLVTMFGSTAILPPRTKRWAEAKVLADCINIRVIKLYLYNNETALALSHHNTHIRKFSDFSRGWGIGEETFEYWSWIARQYRILAEMIEQGTRSTLTLPTHKPTTTVPNLAASQILTNTGKSEADALRSLGINPSHMLQHPGFYYYMAGRCTESRRERFMAALDAELSQIPIALSPGFTNEKKVEHLSIILELYTKAYELFKQYAPNVSQSQSQGRLTLWIAYRIAQTYYESGKFDMAVRFFERIAKTYRREKWGSMLRPLLSKWYACARQLGDVELSVKLLIEMLGHETTESEDPNAIEEDLLAVLQSTVPSEEILVVDLPESQPIFDCDIVFWKPEVKVGEPVAFQLLLTAPKTTSNLAVPFTSLSIQFSSDDSSVTLLHSLSDMELPPIVQCVHVGHVGPSEDEVPQEIEADLRWRPGGVLVVNGTTSSLIPSILKITKVILTIQENVWKVEIPLNPYKPKLGPNTAKRWLSSPDSPKFISLKRGDLSTVKVNHRSHNLVVNLIHQEPAYIDEDYPITIEVTNLDTRALVVSVDVQLQPTDLDDAFNSIKLDDEYSTGLIKGVSLGTLTPGVSVLKTLRLVNRGGAGDRILDISILSRVSGTLEVGTDADENETGMYGDDGQEDKTESLRTITIPVVKPFKVTHDVVYRRSSKPWPRLIDLESFNDDFWDGSKGGDALVNTKIEFVGPWNFHVKDITLERENNARARIVESSTEGNDDDLYSAEYMSGDELSIFSRISLAASDEQDLEHQYIAYPGKIIINWSRITGSDESDFPSRTVLTLPPVQPPRDGLIALLNVPPIGTLHVSMPLSITIRNNQPTQSANITVVLEPDTHDSFVVAGTRNGQVPVLLPGAEEKFIWNLIPIECGQVRLPMFKVINTRGTSTSEGTAGGEVKGDLVQIVNIRRDESQVPDDMATRESNKDGHVQERILILP